MQHCGDQTVSTSCRRSDAIHVIHGTGGPSEGLQKGLMDWDPLARVSETTKDQPQPKRKRDSWHQHNEGTQTPRVHGTGDRVGRDQQQRGGGVLKRLAAHRRQVVVAWGALRLRPDTNNPL